MMTDEKKRSRRGFASMTPERRREVASLGGKGSSPEKRAFKDRELAKRAAKMGAKARWGNNRGTVPKQRADGPQES
jgi:general stress protein YciG